MPDITVTITDEQKKALEWNIVTLQEWADNAIRNKARQCTDDITKEALEDETHSILTLAQKVQVQSDMAALGLPFTTVKKMPVAIKAQIVSNAKIKTAAERQAEFEAAEIAKG